MKTEQLINLGIGNVKLKTAETEELAIFGTSYGSPEGNFNLRHALAEWEGLSSRDEIIVTTGASMGFAATLASLKSPGSILCPCPYYPAYPKVAKFFGLKVIYYDLDPDRGWLPNPQKIAQLIREDTRAIILNFPSNPTGSIPNLSLLEDIATVLAKKQILVISDEVYADFIYEDFLFPNLKTVFKELEIVRLRSFSKAFGIPGERLGYVVGSNKCLNGISNAHWTLAMNPPATAQAFALKLLQSQPHQRIKNLRQQLIVNRLLATEILTSCDRIKYCAPSGGIFCWLEVDECPVNSTILACACQHQAGVIVLPGSVFGIHYRTYLRASFALPINELNQGFEALVRLIQGL